MNEDKFYESVWHCWFYHSVCNQVYMTVFKDDDGIWRIGVSPVYQEVYGGEDDGKKVWAAFTFCLSLFAEQEGVSLTECCGTTRSQDESSAPFLGFIGFFYGEHFELQVYLEPLPGSEVREVLDTFRQEVRAIEPENEAE